MIMKIVFPDGSWFVGDRNQKAIGYIYNHETNGTHHFFVVDKGTCNHIKVGDEVAVPINQTRIFILDYKEC